MSIVEITNISKSFGPLKAVDDVSFNIEQGELFGLLGPNGAGKTTAIRCMLDIFKPDSGSVSILGGADERSQEGPASVTCPRNAACTRTSPWSAA